MKHIVDSDDRTELIGEEVVRLVRAQHAIAVLKERVLLEAALGRGRAEQQAHSQRNAASRHLCLQRALEIELTLAVDVDRFGGGSLNVWRTAAAIDLIGG